MLMLRLVEIMRVQEVTQKNCLVMLLTPLVHLQLTKTARKFNLTILRCLTVLSSNILWQT